MNYTEFAQKIKAKYPDYQELDDRDLAERMVAKYPDYKDVVEFGDAASEKPGMLESAALGAMSGIPGAQAAVSGIQAAGDKTFEQTQAEMNAARDAAWEENPVAYGAGKAAGIVGTGLAAPASLPAMAVMGGLSGLDAATSTENIPTDITKGAGVGTLLGAAGKVISPVISKATDLAKGAGKSVVAKLGKDTTRADVDAYLRNPEAIRNAPRVEEVGEIIAKEAKGVGERAGRLSDEARAALDPKNAMMKKTPPTAADPIMGMSGGQAGEDTIRPVFDRLVERFQQSGVAPTAEKAAAVKVIQDQYTRLAQIAEANGGEVSESALRNYIDSIQDTVNTKAWGDPSVAEAQNALKQLSGELRSLLVKANPKYDEAMRPAAKAAGVASDVEDLFKIEGGRPTDATYNKVRSVLKEGKTEGFNVLQRLKELTGKDIPELINNADIRAAFESAGAGSALKTLAGTGGFGLGKMTGVPFMGIGGAAAGRFGAEAANGATVAKKVLDAYIDKSRAWKNSAIRPMLEKYGRVLADAARAGGTQLSATHFVLGTSDPDYQKLEGAMQDELE